MIHRTLVFVVVSVLALVLQTSAALAQTGQKIAIMPFRVTGVTGVQLEQLSNLSRGLLELTASNLNSQGFLPLTMGAQTLNLGNDAVMAQARQLGADFLFVPSMTKVGNNFNLTGELRPLSAGLVGSKPVSVSTATPDALPQTVERLVTMVTDHLFGGGIKVVSVEISGSSVVENQSMLNSLRIRPGGTYNEAKAASDIRRLHSTGYFDSVSCEVNDVSGGKAVRFIVTQRPQISAIIYKGNSKFDADDFAKVVGVKVMDVASDDALNLAVSNLTRFYADKGYPLAKITRELQPAEAGKASLVFNIIEGGKLFIREIKFEGNEFYSNWRLKHKIQSGKRNFFLSWLTGSGKLDREKLNNDAQIIEAFYQNNGFLQARVGEPEVSSYGEEQGFVVTFPIFEGPRYQVGEVNIDGTLLEDDKLEDLLDLVQVRDEKWFNRELLQEDLNRIRTYYADKGYAHNQIDAQYGEPGSDNRVPVTITVAPRDKVYYNRIMIVGNEKTRDKVIRRHLEVAEGDLTTSSKLKTSQNNLMRSSFFEDINIVPVPGPDMDKMDLRVEVKERPTGAFQIGAGYSNYNSIFGVIKVSQDNLFGYGRRLAVEANVGAESNYFNFSFTDPWVYDLPLMFGLDIFKYYNEYDYYRKDSLGGAIRLGYPVFERFYLTGTYSWEDVDVSDVTSSSQYLQAYMGKSVNSTFTLSLRRDTRNHFFQPTSGSTARFSYTIGSGLFGGDTYFNRFELEGAKWFPLPIFDGAAIMGHAQIGYQKESREGGLPIYEKYMIGGINSVRGYDWYDISPKDEAGESIGGEKMLVMNLELTFPLLNEQGLYAVIFYDMGNVWSASQSYSLSDVKRSYGGGLRYLSPMGPLRIEYGKALNPDPGEPSGRWEFTMGAMF
ncbi:MAG: outer membrane protein assembly factor BamA [Deltaproteobacteria bacterium]|jgi:outer membrane protein insertion porin family|nr:outer membrane protein assembly factor BamA [Deltaproteobacteria bacterium]